MIDTLQYGPQTAEVEALLGRVRTLTDAEAKALETAWYAAQAAAWYAAWAAAWGAAWGAVREAARVAALDAAWDAVWGAVWYAGREAARYSARGATRDAVRDAVLALSIRDLITPDGFTQEHYDLLTGPWRRVVGKVHPGDAEVVLA